jgi:hypothetical protein
MSTRRGSSKWYLEHWSHALGNQDDLIIMNFNGEGRARINKEVLPAFTLLNMCLKDDDYITQRKTTGGFNYRKIAGSDRYSCHAYGLAVDINWQLNPVTRDGSIKTNFLDSTINNILNIKTQDGLPIFRWGGNYNSYKDPMHFEIYVTPAELAVGIIRENFDQKEYIKLGLANKPLRKGDKGNSVMYIQELINETKVLNKPLIIDGDFGNLTQAAVLIFQKAAGIVEDGIVGANTYAKIIEFKNAKVIKRKDKNVKYKID